MEQYCVSDGLSYSQRPRGQMSCRWIDDSRGKTAGGPAPEKCRPFTEQELQSDELKAGAWPVMKPFKMQRKLVAFQEA